MLSLRHNLGSERQDNMATMKQVAEKARVSTTTVSHVINNTRSVSDDAKKRVLDVIAELHYFPSAVARSLKNDKTNTLGMIIPNNSNPYFAELIQGIEDESFRLGYNIILCNSYDDPKNKRHIPVFNGKRIDGLILVPSGSDTDLSLLLSDQALPKVLVDREISGVPADFIEANQEQGGYLATRHLLELGHTNIACVSGPRDLITQWWSGAGLFTRIKRSGGRFSS